MINLILGVGTVLILIYLYFQKCYKYWENKNVPSSRPVFPFGDIRNPLTDKLGFNQLMKKLYNDYKSKGHNYGGLYVFNAPAFMFVNPTNIKDVLTKDYPYFASHGNVVIEEIDPLSAHLFNLDGKKWKDMRVKLTPTFTSGKMKMMFQNVLDCGEQLKEHVNNLNQQGNPLDIKEILACFTTDVIGSCAFGLECNSFKYPDAEFRKYGRMAFNRSSNIRLIIRVLLAAVSPYLVKTLKIASFKREITNFFIGVIRNITTQREKSSITRNDFLQLLVDLRKEAKVNGEAEFTIEQMAAQSFIFFIAGFETSSTTVTWCLYELAHNHEIQDRLRTEINSIIKKHGRLTYDAIMEMKYLDQVVNETLRKHPPVATLTRLCTQEYKLPKNEIIENGTKVFVSVLGIHHDPEYYPNPEKFDPDRFSDENKRNIRPFTFLPFGEGPRICIGLRFGVLQTKVGLCMLLSNYRMYPHESLKYPMEYDPTSIILTAKGTVLLKTEKLNR